MVMVRYQSGENAKEFTEGRQSLGRLHQAVSNVHGLADQAYFASAGPGRPTPSPPGKAPSPSSSPHLSRSLPSGR